MSQAYKNLLTAFANEVGLNPVERFLETEELVIDDITVSLYFEGDDEVGEVVFFSLLGIPAEDRMAEVVRVALEANYLWAGTGGATLGISPDTSHVVIAARLPLDTLSAPALASLLDSFVDTASFWRRYVSGELKQADLAAVPHMDFAIRG